MSKTQTTFHRPKREEDEDLAPGSKKKSEQRRSQNTFRKVTGMSIDDLLDADNDDLYDLE